MDTLWQDLRFACRTLRKNLAFTLVAVLTLGLGIGANSAIFSVVDTVLLTPLPYGEPDALVMVREQTAWAPNAPLSAAEYLHVRAASKTAHVAALDMLDFHLVDGGTPERLSGAMVAVDFFQMLGVEPELGRLFVAAEGEVGENRGVILSHGLWQRRFGGDKDVLGRELRLYWNASFGPPRELGDAFTVVGVLPAGYIGPMGARDVWVPLAVSQTNVESGMHYLFPFARLNDGVAVDTATRELGEWLHQVERPAAQVAGHQEEPGASLTLLSQRAVRNVKTALLVLLGAVGFVLLIACVNVANLMLTRAASRRREVALRYALGASPRRLARQLLVECLVLAAMGGALGVFLAWGGIEAVKIFLPGSLPRAAEIGLDPRVLGFTAAVALFSGLIFGLVPAFMSARPRLRGAIDDASGRTGTRDALVVAEVTFAVVLLVGAGLLLRSFERLQSFPLGFDSSGVLTFEVSLPDLKYSERGQREAFFRDARERLASMPGVESAAVTSQMPLSFVNPTSPFTIEGRPAEDGKVLSASVRQVSQDYFETLRIPLLRGVGLQARDVADEPAVAVVNRAMAERFWEDGEALDARLDLRIFGAAEPVTVVGIVGDVYAFGARRMAPPTVYVPRTASKVASFVARTAGDPELLLANAEREIQALDAELPVANLRTLESWTERVLSRSRFNAFLLGLFAFLALVLAAVGIYGVLSFSVSRRTREVGVRMALGARRADVLGLVMGQGLRLVVLGLALGILASLGLGQTLQSLVFGVDTADTATFAGISIVLLVVAVAAVYLPARRATRVEPVVALRQE